MYDNHGRIRKQILKRKHTEGKLQTYKKGYEIRITVKKEKVNDIIKALKTQNIKNGNPYNKGSCKVIPIYGMNNTQRFINEIVKS